MVQFERVWWCFRCVMTQFCLDFLNKMVCWGISRHPFGALKVILGRPKCQKGWFFTFEISSSGDDLESFWVAYGAIWVCLALFSMRSGVFWVYFPSEIGLWRHFETSIWRSNTRFWAPGNAEKTHIFVNILWWPGFDLELFQVSYGAIRACLASFSMRSSVF